MDLLLRISNGIKIVLERVAFTSGWLIVVLAGITCFDLIGRQFGLPIQLIKFQAMEAYVNSAK